MKFSFWLLGRRPNVTNIYFILQKLKRELDDQADKVQSLDRTGSYLKYFGRKQDTMYIKNLLVGIRLRWKKLLRRTEERGRLLKQAYREDKRVRVVVCEF